MININANFVEKSLKNSIRKKCGINAIMMKLLFLVVYHVNLLMMIFSGVVIAIYFIRMKSIFSIALYAKKFYLN